MNLVILYYIIHSKDNNMRTSTRATVSTFQNVNPIFNTGNFLLKPNQDPNDCRVFEITDESMNDGTIASTPKGSFVLGEVLPGDKWIEECTIDPNTNWIVHTKDGAIFTRIAKVHTENNTLETRTFQSLESSVFSFDDVECVLKVTRRQVG